MVNLPCLMNVYSAPKYRNVIFTLPISFCSFRNTCHPNRCLRRWFQILTKTVAIRRREKFSIQVLTLGNGWGPTWAYLPTSLAPWQKWHNTATGKWRVVGDRPWWWWICPGPNYRCGRCHEVGARNHQRRETARLPGNIGGKTFYSCRYGSFSSFNVIRSVL